MLMLVTETSDILRDISLFFGDMDNVSYELVMFVFISVLGFTLILCVRVDTAAEYV